MPQSLKADQLGLVSDAAASRGTAGLTVTLVAALGLFLIFGAGFVQPDALHNASHDARHAFALPCY